MEPPLGGKPEAGQVRPEPPPPTGAINPDLAWIDKAAQQRLDRMYAVTSAGTRTALIWLAFLLLIWVQNVEPKLAQVRSIQSQRERLELARFPSLYRTDLKNLSQSLQNARDEGIELPFSIKLKVLPSNYVPLFWSMLIVGLLLYLLNVRQNALTLAARAVRLLQEKGNVASERLNDASAGAAWWLAPLPTRDGSSLKADEFWRSLGWSRLRKRALCIAVVAFGLLTIIDFRVVYASIAVANNIVQRRPKPNRHELAASRSMLAPGEWERRTLIFGSLVSAGAFLSCLYFWFRPTRVPDNFAEEPPLDSRRRRDVIGTMAPAITALAFAIPLAIESRTSRLSKAEYLAHNAHHPRFRRKKRRATPSELPDPGLYQNVKSLVFHIISPNGKHRRGGPFHLKEMTSRSADALRAVLSGTTTSRRVIPAQSQPDQVRPSPSAPPDPSKAAPHARLHQADLPKLEWLALAAVKAGRLQEASDILQLGIGRIPLNIRFYDLLAALSVRYSEGWKAAEARQFVISRASDLRTRLSRTSQQTRRRKPRHRRHARKAHGQFMASQQGTLPVNVASIDRRLTNWQDEQSAWYKGWRDHSRAQRWSGLSM